MRGNQFMIIFRGMVLTLCAVLLIASVTLPGSAQAAIILDTGTPDETTNLSVSTNQFLAQEFMLSTSTNITTVEAYIGGSSGFSITMDLADAIGPAATAANLLNSFTLMLPGTSPNAGAFVAANVNQILTAGTYFLVFSSGTPVSGFMPINAPNTIGTFFNAFGSSVNAALPIASDFNDLTSLNFRPGIRISGTSAVTVSEPSTLALFVISLIGLSIMVRQHKQLHQAE